MSKEQQETQSNEAADAEERPRSSRRGTLVGAGAAILSGITASLANRAQAVACDAQGGSSGSVALYTDAQGKIVGQITLVIPNGVQDLIIDFEGTTTNSFQVSESLNYWDLYP